MRDMRKWVPALMACLLLGGALTVGRVQAADPVVTLAAPQGCAATAVAGCTVSGQGYRVTLKFDSTPASLTPFALTLRARPDPVSADVRFVMTGMNMGDNRFAFRRVDDNGRPVWRARAMIPACASGRVDWVAVLRLVYPQRVVEIRVPFATP